MLCTDKTRTITLNQMTVHDVWAYRSNSRDVVETMGLACDSHATRMEKAMLAYAASHGFAPSTCSVANCWSNTRSARN